MNTNEQAAALWCPMVRHTNDGDDIPCNRAGMLPNEIHSWNSCIASRCAMWRVGYVPHRRFHKAENPLASTEAAAGAGKPACPCEFYSDGDNNGEGAGWLETKQHTQTRALGYCGLAPLHRAPGP